MYIKWHELEWMYIYIYVLSHTDERYFICQSSSVHTRWGIHQHFIIGMYIYDASECGVMYITSISWIWKEFYIIFTYITVILFSRRFDSHEIMFLLHRNTPTVWKHTSNAVYMYYDSAIRVDFFPNKIVRVRSINIFWCKCYSRSIIICVEIVLTDQKCILCQIWHFTVVPGET